MSMLEQVEADARAYGLVHLMPCTPLQQVLPVLFIQRTDRRRCESVWTYPTDPIPRCNDRTAGGTWLAILFKISNYPKRQLGAPNVPGREIVWSRVHSCEIRAFKDPASSAWASVWEVRFPTISSFGAIGVRSKSSKSGCSR